MGLRRQHRPRERGDRDARIRAGLLDGEADGHEGLREREHDARRHGRPAARARRSGSCPGWRTCSDRCRGRSGSPTSRSSTPTRRAARRTRSRSSTRATPSTTTRSSTSARSPCRRSAPSRLGNLLGDSFGQALGAYGALLVRGDVAPLPPVITARTFNNGDPAKGTFGLSVPATSVSGGVSAQASAAASVLIGLQQDDSAYTNLGLVNLKSDWPKVQLDFFDGLSGERSRRGPSTCSRISRSRSRAPSRPRASPARAASTRSA